MFVTQCAFQGIQVKDMQKTFQHTATSTEPVRPFLSGKLFQLVLQEPERLTDDDVMLLLKLILHRHDTQELLKDVYKRHGWHHLTSRSCVT